jgi:hypothetical protein
MKISFENQPAFEEVLSTLQHHFGGVQEVATARKGDTR